MKRGHMRGDLYWVLVMGGSPQPQNTPHDRVGSSRRPGHLIGEEWREHARDSLCKGPGARGGRTTAMRGAPFWNVLMPFCPQALLQASHPQLLVQIHWVWLCHPAQWPWRWHSISQTQFPLCKLTSNADLTGLQVASRKCWRAQGPSRSWHPVGMQLMLLGWAQSVNYGSQAWYSVTPNSFSISQLPLKQSLIICGTMGCMFVAEMGLLFFF